MYYNKRISWDEIIKPCILLIAINSTIEHMMVGCYLKGGRGEFEEELHETQHSFGMLISNKSKHDLMRPQQWDQSQCRFGQSRELNQEQKYSSKVRGSIKCVIHIRAIVNWLQIKWLIVLYLQQVTSCFSATIFSCTKHKTVTFLRFTTVLVCTLLFSRCHFQSPVYCNFFSI